jgi:hypothetical protein
VRGVGHGVRPRVFVTNRLFPASCPSVTTGHVGVGHPENALAPVRRSDARSAQIGSPANISQVFQVKANSGEPFTSILARNLLSKHRCRAALGDEIVKSGPKVALVGVSLSLASARKRLTRTGAGPDGAVVCPSCKTEGKAPSSDAGEEVALRVAFEIIRSDIHNAPFVNIARRNVAGGNEVTQPLGGVGVNLVVICAHCIIATPNATNHSATHRAAIRAVVSQGRVMASPAR